MKRIIEKLVQKQDLTKEEAENAMQLIMDGKCSDGEISKFLLSLKEKGESIEEIAAFAKIMREKSNRINPKVENLVDTCGTGGDSSHTFNISTVAAIIAAGAGVKIAKHGNKSVSSKCGSADVLEGLGVSMLQPKEVERCVEKIGIGFMFAPYFHPAMRNVMPVRKALGTRTVFNILGPLTNPANAKAQVLGVFSKELLEKIVKVLKELGVGRALVVNGEGTDEIILGETDVFELKNGEIVNKRINSEEFGFKKSKIPKVNSLEESKKIFLEVLEGKEGPAREVSVLNAAGAIYVSGIASNLEKGVSLAQESIDSGKALNKLEELKNFKGE